MNERRLDPRLLWASAVLGIGGLGVAALVATRSEPEIRKPPEAAPLVRVVDAQPRDWTYVVRTHGTVVPRTESDLIPQVSGEVEWVSPSLVSGGFFAEGEPLVRIEPSDYELELKSAQAAVARAESEFHRARTELQRQRRLEASGAASRSRIDDAVNADHVAEAVLGEARARLARAERDLERTELRAPFVGRVRSEQIDVGQFVNRGNRVATLYAVDYAEVRLPIPDRELRYVNIPLGAQVEGPAPLGPRVRLVTEFAGDTHVWHGNIVRTEGEIDSKSRMVNVVARVEDPYGLQGGEAKRPPLAVGLFVGAEVVGRTVPNVFVLPRAALRPGDPMDPNAPDYVHVVDAENRLHLRPVEVLRTESDQVVIGAGLEPGERVSLARLQAVVDGMSVRTTEETPSESGDVALPVPEPSEALETQHSDAGETSS